MSFALAASTGMPTQWACVSPKQLSDSPSGSCGMGSWPTQTMLQHCKRPLETYLAAPDLITPPSYGSSHLIPAGEATNFQPNALSLCAMERETVQHVQKRMRYSDENSLFSVQGECSIDPLLGNCPLEQSSSASADFASCISDHTIIHDSLHEQEGLSHSQPDSIVWWKQRKPRRQSPSVGSTVCYACQNPFSTDASSHTTLEEKAAATSTAQKKTLLSFFTPTHSTRLSADFVKATSLDATAHHRGSGPVPPIHPSNSTTCAHCERTDLCAGCVRPCQECLASFCVFCSMIDAGGCVCLDCASSQSMRSFSDTDEDMQID